jgi:hypothetical protein
MASSFPSGMTSLNFKYARARSNFVCRSVQNSGVVLKKSAKTIAVSGDVLVRFLPLLLFIEFGIYIRLFRLF